jgi:hypothetical protein
VKQVHRCIPIGDAPEQRSKHHRGCRSEEHLRNANRHSRNPVHDPADSEGFHHSVLLWESIGKIREEEEKTSQP